MPPSRMAEWFEGRRWRVVKISGLATIPQKAVEGEEDAADILVRFKGGKFTVNPPGAFKSPLSGNPGLHGVLLQEVDAEGNDIPGAQYPFGEAAVKDARRDFHAILG
jgi:hypothetical protein